jgi:hypothetical protein
MGKENDPIYLGKELIETISLKVVIGILLVYIIFPFLHYTETDHYVTELQKIIFIMGYSGGITSNLSPQGWNDLLYEYLRSKNDSKYNIVWIHTPNMLNNGRIEEIETIAGIDSNEVPGVWYENVNCTGALLHMTKKCHLRYSEMELFQFDYPLDNDSNEAYSYVRLDIKRIKKEQAKNSFILVILTIALLFLASVNVSNDTEKIMTKPISKMVNTIKKLADDPLRTASALVRDSKVQTDTKTTMLDNMVIKIGKIIELGYGAMGTEVLAENMSNGNGTLDVMVNGQKVNLVILTVKVEDFNKISTNLREESVMFVNKVGSMISECAEIWEGNLYSIENSTFIVTWELPAIDDTEVFRKQEVSEDSAIRVNQALIASIKIIAEFRRSRAIKMFLRSSKLKSVLREFNINIALNFGWSIEGALGFTNRAEAAFISPVIEETIALNKIASKLSLPIVMTEQFYFLLTNKTKSLITGLGLLRWTNAKLAKVCW